MSKIKDHNTKKINEVPKQDIDAVKAFSVKIKNFQDIIKEYDVPNDHISPKIILENMLETLEQYIKIVTQIMQPEDFTSLQECAIFDDAGKSKLFTLYKDMMILHREILKSLIKNDEDESITTINYSYSELKNLKPQIVNIVQKMQDSWKKTGTNGRIRYFG